MKLPTFADGRHSLSIAAVLSLLWLAGCRGTSSPPVAVRLADSYKPELVEGRVQSVLPPPRTEWRFDGPAPMPPPEKFSATRGWEAGSGIADLAIKNGRLTGRTASDLPILHLERGTGLEDRDNLHAVEVRLRVSAGGNLTVAFDNSEKVDFNDLISYARDFWDIKTPIVPGDRIQTYTLRSPYSEASSRMKHIFIRPTDASGAQFEIESIRLIFRKEYLAGVPSGVGWQGLSEVYRETLVTRTPEKIKMPVKLGKRPWLDLALGTVENEPVTFRVAVSLKNSAREDLLLEKTLTTPHRWESSNVDLRRFADQTVVVSFSLESGKKGAIGFWGSPVVRNAGAMPPVFAADGNSAQRPQGVILVWADTLRRDHLDVYGYNRPTAPHIRRMAADGTLFQDCVSQATWTKVATPSLMTSLYPTSHGVHDFFDRLPVSATTLAEVFQQAGYATLSMSSILFTGKFTNLHQGFDEVHEDRSLPDLRSSKTARVYVDRLLPWLETHREVPFFVFLHISDPHDPYRPYPPYDTMWADASRLEEHERQSKEVRKFIAEPLLKLFGMPTREELTKAGYDPDAYVAVDRDLYDGSIRAMDAEIGRLIERLQMLGLDKKTLIVFLGDHGEEFLEHGRMFHGQSVYGELSNVPLILWGPGIVPPHKIINETVETIDLMPTILAISELPVPAGVQGESLTPLLAATSAAALKEAEAVTRWSRPAVTEKAMTTTSVGAPPPINTESYSIILDGWKLIHNPKRASGKPEYELYEERKDPLDQINLATQHPEIVNRLAKELAAWRIKASAERLKPDAESSIGLSQEELERLRSLGYIQ